MDYLELLEKIKEKKIVDNILSNIKCWNHINRFKNINKDIEKLNIKYDTLGTIFEKNQDLFHNICSGIHNGFLHIYTNVFTFYEEENLIKYQIINNKINIIMCSSTHTLLMSFEKNILKVSRLLFHSQRCINHENLNYFYQKHKFKNIDLLL